MKGWGREAAIWHYKRLGEAIGEVATSVAVEGLGLKGSWKEVYAWQHEESLGEAIGENEAQLQKTPALWRCQYNGIITKNSSILELEPGRV